MPVHRREPAKPPRAKEPSSGRVADVMTWPAISVRGELIVRDAIEVLREHQIHHLPVVSGLEILGVVCGCDLQTEPQQHAVQDVVEVELPTIHMLATVERALEQMDAANDDYLLVTGLPLLGVVTRTDLSRAGLEAKVGCAACGGLLHVRNDAGGVPFCADCVARACNVPYEELGAGD